MAALLRGVNVGGHRKLPMSEFRDLLGGLGFGAVATYIQSGNAVFDAPGRPGEVAAAIGEAVAERFGFTVPVMVRTAAEIEALLDADPFAGRGLDESKVIVMFLDAAPPVLEVPEDCPEEVVAAGREVWVYYPTGQGTSRLGQRGFWKPIGEAAMTGRNLRTLKRLRDMANGE
nr:DUF1697 domain-containing protein [Glycomyces buryatensis]